ncbi:UNVERIFIED_CONTAM: hypothetical protein GTU68_007450 [Idotea baltica]|nr:hypothetical protein [Idotea baltica]
MNTNPTFGREFVQKINDFDLPKDVEVILGVPFLSIPSLVPISGKVSIAAQNCHHEDSGAYTGEISTTMLKSVDCPYVILGHSERRQYFKESDDLILTKMHKVMDQGMKVIYCCGEPLEVREKEEQAAFVENQLKNSICKLTKDQMSNVIIAYEPIWAIGTGKTASPEQAQSMHQHIRMANDTSILYGGSVKPANAKEIFSKEDVDGGLVGGASLKVDSFYEIIQSF